MDNDISCTQPMPDIWAEDSDNSLNEATSSRRKIGVLKVLLKGKSITQREFAIFRGQNIIGRHSACDISIPWSAAMSKKHAIIEAENETCFLSDCGSSNKTRFGKVQLKPNVKFGLRDGDEITFGDVKCVFHQHYEKDGIDPGSDTGGVLARDTPDLISDERFPSMIVPDSPPAQVQHHQSENRRITDANDVETPTEDSHANETDVTHISDSNGGGDINYHMDSDTDIEDNKVDLDETCMSEEDIYLANTLPFEEKYDNEKSTNQKLEGSQYDDELNDEDDYEMSLIADLAAEQNQKLNQVKTESGYAQPSDTNESENTVILENESQTENGDIPGSSKVEHNEEDIPGCSRLNRNPMPNLLNDTYDNDSFGDLCTQAFIMPKKSALCEDTLGLLETQAMVLPINSDDEPNIDDSILDDMPTQAFPINIDLDGDTQPYDHIITKSKREILVQQQDIIDTSTSEQNSPNPNSPCENENESPADLISGLSGAIPKKQSLLSVSHENQHASDETSFMNTEASVRCIGKSDEDVESNETALSNTSSENMTVPLSGETETTACDLSLENDDTLPLISQNNDSSTEVKSGFSLNSTNKSTFCDDESCDDDTQPLEKIEHVPCEISHHDDSTPSLPRTKDVVVPLETYFSDRRPKNHSIDCNGDMESADMNHKNKHNFEKPLCVHHRATLSALNWNEVMLNAKSDGQTNTDIKCSLGTSTEDKNKTSRTRSSTALAQSKEKMDQPITDNVTNAAEVTPDPQAYDAPGHKSSVLGGNTENEISDDEETQEYYVPALSKEETTSTIVDASADMDTVTNATVENHPSANQNIDDKMETSLNDRECDDDAATQVYEMISVEEIPIASDEACAHGDNIAKSAVENPPVDQKVAKVTEVSPNLQISGTHDDDATQEYDVNCIEDPSTAVNDQANRENKQTISAESTLGDDSGTPTASTNQDTSSQTSKVVSSKELEKFDTALGQPTSTNPQQALENLTDENDHIIKGNASVKPTASSEVETGCFVKVQPSESHDEPTQIYCAPDKSNRCTVLSIGSPQSGNQPMNNASADGTAPCETRYLESCVKVGSPSGDDISASSAMGECSDHFAATQSYIKPISVKASVVIATCSVAVRKDRRAKSPMKCTPRMKNVPSSHLKKTVIKKPPPQNTHTESNTTLDNQANNAMRYSLTREDNPTTSASVGSECTETQSFIKQVRQQVSDTSPTNAGRCSAAKCSSLEEDNLPLSANNYDVSGMIETQSFIKQPQRQVLENKTVLAATLHIRKNNSSNCTLLSDETLPSSVETPCFVKQPEQQIPNKTTVSNLASIGNISQNNPSISHAGTVEISPIRTRSRRSARKDYAKLAKGDPLPGGRRSIRKSTGEIQNASPKQRIVKSRKKSSLKENISIVQSTSVATEAATSTRSTRSKASTTQTIQTKPKTRSQISTNLVTQEIKIEVPENVTDTKATAKSRSAKSKKSSIDNPKTASHSTSNTVASTSKKTKTLPKRSLRNAAPSETISQEDIADRTKSQNDNDVYNFESSAELSVESVSLIKRQRPPVEDRDNDPNVSVPSTSTAKRRASKRGIAAQSSKSTQKTKAVATSAACETAESSTNNTGRAKKRRNCSPESSTAKRSKSNESDQISRNRPKRATHKPKVMFTGIMDGIAEAIVTNLGGSLATDINECTHLVTDKMRRTIKFLCAVSIGVHIVTTEWLHKSNESKRFLPEEQFHLTDDLQTLGGEALQTKYNFDLQDTLKKVRESENRLFHNLTIFVTKNVAPNQQQMKQILESAGAKVLTKMPNFNNKETNTNLVIISTLDDKRSLSNAIKSGCKIVSNEFVLTGVLRHQVDFTSFNLFGAESSGTLNLPNLSLSTSAKRRRT